MQSSGFRLAVALIATSAIMTSVGAAGPAIADASSPGADGPVVFYVDSTSTLDDVIESAVEMNGTTAVARTLDRAAAQGTAPFPGMGSLPVADRKSAASRLASAVRTGKPVPSQLATLDAASAVDRTARARRFGLGGGSAQVMELPKSQPSDGTVINEVTSGGAAWLISQWVAIIDSTGAIHGKVTFRFTVSPGLDRSKTTLVMTRLGTAIDATQEIYAAFLNPTQPNGESILDYYAPGSSVIWTFAETTPLKYSRFRLKFTITSTGTAQGAEGPYRSSHKMSVQTGLGTCSSKCSW